MKDIVKEKQLKEVLYGLDYIANKAKSGKLELGVNNCKLLLEEIERLNNKLLLIKGIIRTPRALDSLLAYAMVKTQIENVLGSDKE